MASSTRKKAIEIWGYSLPEDDPEKLSQVLFSFENLPGKKEISGSQDSIGIVYPGLNKLNYDGEYWPSSIESNLNNDTLKWLEDLLYFVPLSPRDESFDVLGSTSINAEKAKELAVAADGTWEALQNKNASMFGESFRKSFDAQVAMFPNMVNREVLEMIGRYENTAIGWKLSGAGGGGYLVLVSEQEIEDSIRINIRR